MESLNFKIDTFVARVEAINKQTTEMYEKLEYRIDKILGIFSRGEA